MPELLLEQTRHDTRRSNRADQDGWTEHELIVDVTHLCFCAPIHDQRALQRVLFVGAHPGDMLRLSTIEAS